MRWIVRLNGSAKIRIYLLHRLLPWALEYFPCMLFFSARWQANGDFDDRWGKAPFLDFFLGKLLRNYSLFINPTPQVLFFATENVLTTPSSHFNHGNKG